ncbi:carbohydrate ABC transporter permease [Candidatus Bipolaricaulota bacterium]|nr:carbohydrate ABC transporter permease [Candidatus Bipolaricaulota bacterium]
MRKTITYSLLVLLAVFMVGPLVYSFFSNDPLSWPPKLASPKLWPPNWAAAWSLGVQGAGNGWTGGWAPGGKIEFGVAFRYPGGDTDPPLPRAQLLAPPYELGVPNPVPVTQAEVTPWQERPTEDGGLEVAYKVILTHQGSETYPLLPLAIIGAPGSKFITATLPPDSLSTRVSGTYVTWRNVAPGAIGYLFDHYVRAWTTFKGEGGRLLFPRWIGNSFLIAALRVVITVVFATMAGYALSRLRFPGRNFLFFFVIFTMMIPGQVTMISNYLVVRDGVFGLSKLVGLDTFLNTFWALFLPALVSSSAVFMMKQFMESIPKEIEEAARIDGANTFQIYTRIILPLSLPAIAAVSILTFQGAWNEFFWPMVVLTQPKKYTLPLGLNYLLHYYQAGATGSVWNMILAGTVISVIPVLVIYILFQRYFIEGFHLSGIKQ